VAGDADAEIPDHGVAALQQAIDRAARVAHNAGMPAGHDSAQQVAGRRSAAASPRARVTSACLSAS
jgi:hypothetical protein